MKLTKEIKQLEGIHTLKGFETKYFTLESGDTTEGCLIKLDNKTYQVYIDPDDGYRSYGVFSVTNEHCKEFPIYEKVKVEILESSLNYKENTPQEQGIVLKNVTTNDIILEISESMYDNYYPMGHYEWHPENMTINQDTDYGQLHEKAYEAMLQNTEDTIDNLIAHGATEEMAIAIYRFIKDTEADFHKRTTEFFNKFETN